MHDRGNRTVRSLLLFLAAILLAGLPAVARAQRDASALFPAELVEWTPGPDNPVFTAQGPGHWDVKIRERGWILREGDNYYMWYTGYDGTNAGIKQLGYATSPDGLHWTPWPTNPVHRDHWVEDVMVVKQGDTYLMFSEGPKNGHAELLTSTDRVHWNWEGPLDIRLADGTRPAKKPCGTPTVWVEDGRWYLFYEWLDLGVWVATTKDPRSRVWINVRDEPVLVPGPGDYDSRMIALDQVIKQDDAYFAYYHGTGNNTDRTWSTSIARSTDLLNWQKYARNPIIGNNKSSGIVVPDGHGYRLYTMHQQVDVFYPRSR